MGFSVLINNFRDQLSGIPLATTGTITVSNTTPLGQHPSVANKILLCPRASCDPKLRLCESVPSRFSGQFAPTVSDVFSMPGRVLSCDMQQQCQLDSELHEPICFCGSR
eukprot:3436261-Amphidinium_carterae.1